MKSKQQLEMEAEQKDMSYDEIKAQLEKQSEFMLELDNLPKQNHIWIDRGEKYSCESAGHAYHQAWKQKRR